MGPETGMSRVDVLMLEPHPTAAFSVLGPFGPRQTQPIWIDTKRSSFGLAVSIGG